MAAPTNRRDFGHIFLRGTTYWIRYAVEKDGKRQRKRESTGSTSLRVAEKLLARREMEIEGGTFTAPDAKRLTFSDLAQMVRDDYRKQGRRSLPTLNRSLKHLAAFFPGKALGITTDRVTAYECYRLDAGAARATVNKELAALRRAFHLAIRARRLPSTARPDITTPDPHNARTGFFEEGDFAAVLAQLAPDLRLPLQFAYWTGWRVQDEVLTLTWAQVDLETGVVRLEPNTTKTDEGRVFPFGVLPKLDALLRAQRVATSAVERQRAVVVPWVFHRNGKPIKSYYAAWRAACKRASVEGKGPVQQVVRPGLVGRVPHDFRRTAARNLIRAGVAQHVVMKLCGWKTDAMFRRYAVVDERDLREAVTRLAGGTEGAQTPPGARYGPS